MRPYVDADPNLATQSSIYVLPDTTYPCLYKSVCTASGDSAGQTIRFKLRVQNLGRQALTGWKIRDNLRSVGLEYTGNALFYRTPTRLRVDTLCGMPAGATNWSSNVSTNWNTTTGILTHTLTTLANNECDSNSKYENQLNIGCNGGTALPAYYIEFDARILDTAALGMAKNIAYLTNDSTWSVAADAVFNVRGLSTFSVDKAVRITPTANWAQSGTVQPGQVVQYRLHANGSGAPVRNPFFIDLLPKNDGHLTATTTATDRYLTNPLPRGSNMDMTFAGQVSSAPAISSIKVDNSGDLNLLRDFGTSSNFGINFSNWIQGSPSKNFKIDYPILSSLTPDLNYVFNALVVPDFGATTACNTAGFTGYQKVMRNFQPVLELLLPTESSPVCVNVAGDSTCCRNDTVLVPSSACANTPVQFCAQDRCNEGINYHWEYGDGTADNGNCVTHTYGTPGTYLVNISWTECGRDKRITRFVTITDCNQACCCGVDSVIHPKQVCSGFAADFCVVAHCDKPMQFTWDFGDGTTPVTTTNSCVSHTYQSKNNYPVVVTWQDCNGDNRSQFEVEATECNAACDIKPEFTFNAKDNCPMVNFVASPAQNNLMYVWDFGDGTFGTGQTTSHYYGSGSFNVILYVYSVDPRNGSLCKCMAQIARGFDMPECGQTMPLRPGTSIAANGKMAVKPNLQTRVATGLEPLTAEDLSAVPNPFTQVLNVQYTTKKPDKAASYTLYLLNANGSTVSSQPLSANGKVTINTQGLPSGTYLLSLRGKDGTSKSLKVIKLNH